MPERVTAAKLTQLDKNMIHRWADDAMRTETLAPVDRLDLYDIIDGFLSKAYNMGLQDGQSANTNNQPDPST